MTSSRCPKVVVESRWLGKHGEKDTLAVEAKIGNKLVGQVHSIIERKTVQVGNARVHKDFQRCKIGTRLYKKTAQIACRIGRTLESDSIRTDASESFWKKQEEKGRAVCNPGWGIRSATDDGAKYWLCHTYELKCPVKSLDGARNRRR